MASSTVAGVCRLVVASRAAAVASMSRSTTAAPRVCQARHVAAATFAARRGLTSSGVSGRSAAGAVAEGGTSATDEGGGGGGGVGDAYDYEGMDPQTVLQEVTKKLMDCRRRKAAANAVDLLVSLGRAGIEPDLLASTTCLGACVASGKMDLALKVFEEVFEKGVVKPDEIVFTELMRGHLAADPPTWARVMGVLNRMPTYEVRPTALTYNLLLAKCADDNELERAEDLIERMAEEEVEPDKHTLDAVKKRRSIRSYAKKMLLL